MRYAVVSSVNGAVMKVESEWDNNISGARVNFWDKCKAYENDNSTRRAVVALMNENWDIVEDKKEIISHEEPEPNVEV